MKQMLVHCHDDTVQMALIEDGKLVEYAAERSRQQSIVGSFYLGKVVNVLPGMQAAFVDIGLKKNAFLYVDDVLHPHLEKQPNPKPSISELLHVGQEVMVQVMKDARGGKGPRITTHYSLPGRCTVYMPTADYVAVSKKIQSEGERDRLRMIGERLKMGEEGFIMRTVAEDEPEQTILNDLEYLREEWEMIQSKASRAAAPALLHRDLGILQRFIRDMFDPDSDELIIDDEAKGAEAAVYLKDRVNEGEPNVQLYRDAMPLFQRYGVDEQLKMRFSRKIMLPEGVAVVIDHTEAMTVVDVNTARFIGGDNFEETVLRANLLAAEEIAGLLRLRDIGGIIMIDFIDMDREEHRQQVTAAIEKVMAKDRSKSYIVGWTKLGLLEMTRKKARESVLLLSYKPCPACGGRGVVEG